MLGKYLLINGHSGGLDFHDVSGYSESFSQLTVISERDRARAKLVHEQRILLKIEPRTKVSIPLSSSN